MVQQWWWLTLQVFAQYAVGLVLHLHLSILRIVAQTIR
jgi:hypothetical protein